MWERWMSVSITIELVEIYTHFQLIREAPVGEKVAILRML